MEWSDLMKMFTTKSLLKDLETNRNVFYGCMRQLQTVKDRVVALKQRGGLLTSSDQQAADVLANYFSEMFTREDEAGISYQEEMENSLERHRRGPKQCCSLTEIKKFESRQVTRT